MQKERQETLNDNNIQVTVSPKMDEEAHKLGNKCPFMLPCNNGAAEPLD